MTTAMNNVMLIGYVGRDPIFQFTSDGKRMAKFPLATNEVWYVHGERKQHTEWHSIVAWRKIADLVAEKVRCGDKLLVEGRLRSRVWADGDGTRCKQTYVQVRRVHLFSEVAEGVDSGCKCENGDLDVQDYACPEC